MKFFIIFLSLFIACIELKAQQSFYCVPNERLEITTNPKKPANKEFPNKINNIFDWTVDSIKIQFFDPERIAKVATPYYQFNNPRNNELLTTKDVFPENGWELIDFGGSLFLKDSDKMFNWGWPFIILYNRYKGILRVFVLLKPHIEEGYKYQINFMGYYEQRGKSLESSVFDNYQPINSQDNMNNVTGKFYYPLSLGEEFWNWGDIPVTYDPCSCNYDDLLRIHTNIYEFRHIINDGKPAIQSSEYIYCTPSFGLPGSIFDTSNISNDYKKWIYPYYNNILGTFNLLRTPEINYSTKFDKDYHYHLKINTELEYVLNPAAGFVMDSSNLSARFVLEFSNSPSIYSNQKIYEINDTTYESAEIPIGCLRDFSFDFSSPFRQPPNRVYLKLSGEFIKKDKSGNSPVQYLEKSFKTHLLNRNDIGFSHSYWLNNYNGNCRITQLPFNLDDRNMAKFCNGDEYLIKSKSKYLDDERRTRELNDSIIANNNFIDETRIYEIYPNPATNLINIEFTVIDESIIKLSIVDEIGRIVVDKSFEGINFRGKHKFDLDVSHLSAGMYFAILEVNARNFFDKFIILRD